MIVQKDRLERSSTAGTGASGCTRAICIQNRYGRSNNSSCRLLTHHHSTQSVHHRLTPKAPSYRRKYHRRSIDKPMSKIASGVSTRASRASNLQRTLLRRAVKKGGGASRASLSSSGSRRSLSRVGSRRSLSRSSSRQSLSRRSSRNSLSRQGSFLGSLSRTDSRSLIRTSSRQSISRTSSRQSLSRTGSRSSFRRTDSSMSLQRVPSSSGFSIRRTASSIFGTFQGGSSFRINVPKNERRYFAERTKKNEVRFIVGRMNSERGMQLSIMFNDDVSGKKTSSGSGSSPSSSPHSPSRSLSPLSRSPQNNQGGGKKNRKLSGTRSRLGLGATVASRSTMKRRGLSRRNESSRRLSNGGKSGKRGEKAEKKAQPSLSLFAGDLKETLIRFYRPPIVKSVVPCCGPKSGNTDVKIFFDQSFSFPSLLSPEELKILNMRTKVRFNFRDAGIMVDVPATLFYVPGGHKYLYCKAPAVPTGADIQDEFDYDSDSSDDSDRSDIKEFDLIIKASLSFSFNGGLDFHTGGTARQVSQHPFPKQCNKAMVLIVSL